MGGGKETDGQQDIWSFLSWVHTSQLSLYAVKQGLQCTQISYNYFVTEEDKKVECAISGDTVITSSSDNGLNCTNLSMPRPFLPNLLCVHLLSI